MRVVGLEVERRWDIVCDGVLQYKQGQVKWIINPAEYWGAVQQRSEWVGSGREGVHGEYTVPLA